jgi:hypothetical protein
MKDTHRMRIYPPTPEHVAITKSVQEVEDMFTQDIRETLYADDGGIVNVVEKLNESLPPLPTVIDLSDGGDYVIEGGKNSIVVVTANPFNFPIIILPAAIVGLRVTIINQDQDDASVNICPAKGEYINGSDNTHSFELAALNSATFYCYADGKWAII